MWAPTCRRSPPPKRSPAVHSRTPGGRAPDGPAANHRTANRRGAHRLLGGMAGGAVPAGCEGGPNYPRPQKPEDAHFSNAGEPGLKDGDAVERYWTGFADPLLNGLVDDALAHNKDLGVAEANLQAGRVASRLRG